MTASSMSTPFGTWCDYTSSRCTSSGSLCPKTPGVVMRRSRQFGGMAWLPPLTKAFKPYAASCGGCQGQTQARYLFAASEHPQAGLGKPGTCDAALGCAAGAWRGKLPRVLRRTAESYIHSRREPGQNQARHVQFSEKRTAYGV